jgi:hypothetical protein
MKPRLTPRQKIPEQRYKDEFKIHTEFIPIFALSSRLSVVVIAKMLFLLNDPVVDSQ